MSEELKITEVTAFPTLFLGFDLRELYDKDKVVEGVDKLITPHGLIESENEGDGSTWGSSSYLEEQPELTNLMQRCVDAYVDKLKLEPLGVWNSWINKGSHGSKTNPHRHEGSVISGAFLS